MALIKGKQLEDDTVTASKADTTNGGIAEINAGDSAVEGSGTGLSRRDHQHAVDHTGTVSTVAVGDSAAEGSAAGLARADHTHAVTSPGAPADVTKAAAAAGSSADVARADHKHDVTTAAPSDVGTANAEGSATSLARSDHVHDHGDHAIGDGNQHAVATASLAGFMSATDKTKLDSAQDLDEIDAKESCRARTQGDHALTGLAAIDTSVTPVDGDRILVDQQSTPAEDGIYIADTSTWSRAADAPTGAEARGWRVWIEEGTADGDKLYACSNNKGSDIVGTDGLTFGLIGAGSPRGAGDGLNLNGNNLEVLSADGSLVASAGDLKIGALVTGATGDASHGTRAGGTLHDDVVSEGADGFMTGADKKRLDDMGDAAQPNDTPQQEAVTTETVTASDTALGDALDNTPLVSAVSLDLWLNGVHQKQGAGFDYTVVASTGVITWLASTGTAVDMETSDTLDASYLS
jgi:hypothetical protein